MRKLQNESRNRRTLPLSAVNCQWLEAAGGDEGEKLPRFRMTAYNGGVMHVRGWENPVVVDLKGLEAPAGRGIPVLQDHFRFALVGHTESIKIGKSSVDVEGVISGNTPEAEQVRVMGQRKFPWQASMGLSVSKVETLEAGQTAVVNGNTVTGPADIARQSSFQEVSVVAWGADSTTTTNVAARNRDMYEDLLELLNVDASSLTEEQARKLAAMLLQLDSGEPHKDEAEDGSTDTKPVQSSVDPIAEIRKSAAAEFKRVAAINVRFKEFPELAAKAIEDGWDDKLQQAELRAAKAEKIAADRAGAGIDTFNVSVQDSSMFDDQKVVEAALCMTANMPEWTLTDPLKHVTASSDRRRYQDSIHKFDEKTLDFAHKHFAGMGPQKAALWCARKSDQFSGIWGTDVERGLKAAFSTVQLPTVFQNVITRMLLSFVPDKAPVWNRIAKAGSTRDFRTVTKFRVYGTGHWEKITGDSTLKHGTIDESAKYSNRLGTRGQYLEMTREDFINDDVGALTDIGGMMGRYGMLAPEVGTIETLLANSGSFFAGGNGNYISGATTVLGDVGLKALYQTFRKRPDGRTTKDTKTGKAAAYIDVEPRMLLVPAELFLTAWEMTNASALSTAPASTRVSPSNFFANRFEVLDSPYLSDTAVHANASATAFYLLADPGAVETISILFLNGNQRPTIEMATPRPDVLGMAIRGYIDFGVALVDPRGGALSKGAA